MHHFARTVLLISLGAGVVATSSLARNGEVVTDASSTRGERICGWFENPTPANAWLTDRNGQWIIGIQGDYQAEGPWPEFDEDTWVETNRHHGYGCACVDATLDRSEHRVTRIFKAAARPLNACRRDKAIEDLEPAA